MKIKDVKFIKSVFIDDNKVIFDKKREIIFIWRSNVGKSSIMNSLFNKKDLVKTSSKAGKTKTANLFLVNNKYYFTDLPWYGFAKLWKHVLEKLDALNSWYISERAWFIKKVVLLVDSKIWLQSKDIEMFNYIQSLDLAVVIVLSKTDRLSRSELLKSKMHVQKELFWQKIIPVSSHKKTGVSELFRELSLSLEDK